MLIQVRLQAAQAQRQIIQLRAQLAGLQASSNAAVASTGRIGNAGAIAGLKRWGNQIQWAGRQLQYNFTLPLVLAGGFATKWALQNEAAMTRVRKVYGDGTQSAKEMSNELTALGKNFEALSSRFGVAQKDVINIGADWAAAGASGQALAKSVRLTLETMILGELDAATATKSLIAIQAQYGQSITQLSGTIDILNMVENQTGTTMADLIDAMARSAGVARTAGVDVHHLAAFTAALVPAAGSAAAAGNALKTIFSRLFAPTKDASNALKFMGINIQDLGWKSLNGSKRLQVIADKFKTLKSSQQAQISTMLAGRYQVSRFEILMKALVNPLSYYRKGLDSSASAQKNFAQRNKELQQVLNSNPQKLKIIGTTLQNSLARVIQPLLPMIVMVANSLGRMATAFSNLSPAVQKAVIFGLAFIAVVGPITKYVGALTTLITVMGEAFFFFGRTLGGALTGLFKLAIWPFVKVAAGFRLVALGIWSMVGSLFGMVGKLFPLLGGALLAMLKRVLFTVIWMSTGVLVSLATMLERAVILLAGFATDVMAVGLAGVLRGAVGVIGLAMTEALQTIMVILRAWRVGFTLLWISVFGTGPVLVGIWEGIIKLYAIFMATLARIQTAGSLLLSRIWAALWAFMSAPGWALRVIAVVGTFYKTLFALSLTFAKRILFLLRSPWVLAAAAIIGAIVYIQDHVKGGFQGVLNFLKTVWNNISKSFTPVVNFFHNMINGLIRAFYALPQGIQSAFLAVVNIVAKAAQAVYKLFSYFNPFAKHSPSLVESTKKGMKQVSDHHAAVGDIGGTMKQATGHVQQFKAATASMPQAQPFSQERTDLSKMLPKALPEFDRLVQDYKDLNVLAAKQQTLVDAQQKIVDVWKTKLDAANNALDIQQNKLNDLQKTLSKLTDAYDAHKNAMQGFADAPIQGMKAMTDSIFANQQAQKGLQLQILQWQQANGSIDAMANRLSSLAGDIDQLKGTAKDLRIAGAGSDVLGPMNDQINQMQAAYNALNATAQNNPIADLQNQLDALNTQGQVLDLQNSLQFDPQIKSIQDLANAQKELSYDAIIAGVTRERAAMDAMQPSIDKATAAVDKQQLVVNRLTDARDKISRVYDTESKKLDKLNNTYDKITGAIQKITDALNTMGSAASAALKSADTGKLGGAGANFPDPGGSAKIGREGKGGDQSKLIDQLTKDMQDQASKALGSFGDIFKPIKEGWNKAWAWIRKNLGPVVSNLGSGIVAAFKGIGDAARKGMQSSFGQGFVKGLKSVGDFFKTLIDWIVKLTKLYWPDIKRTFEAIWTVISHVFERLIPTVAKFWNQIKPLVALLAIALAGAIKVVASVFSNVLVPVLDVVIGVVDSVLNIIGGIIDFVVNVFTLQWGKAWGDVVQIFKAVWNGIYSIIGGFVKIVWGIVKGFVNGVVGFFKWLYNVLVGHSIIPDLVHAIVTLFRWIIAPIKAVWHAILAGVKAVWYGLILPVFNGIKTAIKIWAGVFSWVWDHLIRPAWNAVWGGIKAVWTSVGAPIWGGIKTAVHTLGTLFHDVGRAIGKSWDLIWSGLKSAWNLIGKTVFQSVANVIVGAVNIAIMAINALARGFNAITGLLHINFKIGTIDHLKAPKFAMGGELPISVVGSGFKTNGPRAIVGEGGHHPEYVIPTDPRYRKRALDLWKNAGHDIQMLGIGGSIEGGSGSSTPNVTSSVTPRGPGGRDTAQSVLGFGRGDISPAEVNISIADSYKWLEGQVKSHRSNSDKIMGAIGSIGGAILRGGVKAIFWPFKTGMEAILKTLHIEFLRKMGQSILDKVWNWIDTLAKHKDKEHKTPDYGHGPNVDRFAPVAFEGAMRVHGWGLLQALQTNKELPHILRRLQQESGGDPNAINLTDSNAKKGTPSMGIMQVIQPTFDAYAGALKHLGIWQPRSNMYAGLNYAKDRYGDINKAMDKPGGYAAGGVLPRFSAGGIATRATPGIFGEVGKEILAPLDPLWRKLDRIESQSRVSPQPVHVEHHVHIHGDLSFPNITGPDDAEKFIKNLEVLAGKG